MHIYFNTIEHTCYDITVLGVFETPGEVQEMVSKACFLTFMALCYFKIFGIGVKLVTSTHRKSVSHLWVPILCLAYTRTEIGTHRWPTDLRWRFSIPPIYKIGKVFVLLKTNLNRFGNLSSRIIESRLSGL